MIFCPWLGKIAAVPLWARTSAAPGFGRSPFPEALPPPGSRFNFFSNFLSFFSIFLSFLFSFFSPSFVSCPAADFGLFLIYPALLGFRTLPPPPTPPSPLGLSEGSRGPPPRRTASGEAYSTLSFRPSREWFRGLISEAVACSVDVKSTNAHLGEIWYQRPPYKGGGEERSPPFTLPAILESPHPDLPYPLVFPLRSLPSRFCFRLRIVIFFLVARALTSITTGKSLCRFLSVCFKELSYRIFRSLEPEVSEKQRRSRRLFLRRQDLLRYFR